MKDKAIYILLAIYLVAGLLTIHYFNGTGDEGDSVQHYLFARYAPQHPKLFFDHWAKPLYVLLASPFAQFGMNGLKCFNLLISLLTVFFTYQTARLYGYRNAILAALFVICAPLNYILTFSGLTEPLFALCLILGIYLAKKDKAIASAIIISFLPFVRSEGLIFAGVFGFWFLLDKRYWKAIPFLLFGHVFYSVAGYFAHKDLLWIFTKIPYATLNSIYGEGTLDHFVKQLNFILGIPLYVLLWMGLAAFVVHRICQWKSIFTDESVLIVGGFLAFFVAHTLFWYLGIFNSMGLKRVFVGVMPLMALIALKGFHFFTGAISFKPNLHKALQFLIVLVVAVFPFTGNRAAIGFSTNMTLTRDQELAKEAGTFLAENPTNSGVYYYAHPYLSEVLHRDYFDPNQRRDLKPSELQHLRKGDLVIWENWFAVVENNMKEEDLNKIPGLHQVRIFHTSDAKGTSRFVIYRKE